MMRDARGRDGNWVKRWRWIVAAGLVTVPSQAVAQEEFRDIPWSQRGAVIQRVGYTDFSITYSRPVARGRTLFGELVRWDRIWHPGADSATTLELSHDIEVEGHRLPAGGYTLWMIPREREPWTVIFNRSTGIYHSPYPGDETDVLRLEVAPQRGAHMEVLSFYFPEMERQNAVLRFHWGETMLPLRISTRAEP